MLQDDKGLLTVILSYATPIFLKGQIEHPVQSIFDALKASYRPKGLSVANQSHEVVATFTGHLLTHFGFRFDNLDTS